MTTGSLLTSRRANGRYNSRGVSVRHRQRRRNGSRHGTLIKGIATLVRTTTRRQGRAITRITNGRHGTTRRRQTRAMRGANRTRRQRHRGTSVLVMTTNLLRLYLLLPSREFVRG